MPEETTTGEAAWKAATRLVMLMNSPSSDEEEYVLSGVLGDMWVRQKADPLLTARGSDALRAAYEAAIDLRVYSEAAKMEGHEELADVIGLIDIALLRYRKILNARR